MACPGSQQAAELGSEWRVRLCPRGTADTDPPWSSARKKSRYCCLTAYVHCHPDPRVTRRSSSPKRLPSVLGVAASPLVLAAGAVWKAGILRVSSKCSFCTFDVWTELLPERGACSEPSWNTAPVGGDSPTFRCGFYGLRSPERLLGSGAADVLRFEPPSVRGVTCGGVVRLLPVP